MAFPGLVVTGSFELQVWVLWSLKEQYELIGPEPPPAPVYCKAGFSDCGFEFNRNTAISILAQA